MNRVVITGAGIISPIGNSVTEFERGLREGKNGIDFITKFDTTEYKAKLAAEVKDFDPLQYYETVLEARRSDLFTQYAVAAATQAMENSGIAGNVDEDRLGVYFGSGIGGLITMYNESVSLHTRGPRRVSPLFIPMTIGNMAAGAISIRFQARGATLPVVTACATSATAVGEAYRAIKHGYADAIIAGGAEAAICPLGVSGFMSCKALSFSEDPNAASIPFDKRRNGFVMGEGAAALILEEYEHAVRRNAKIYAEVVGYGNTADAYHVTSPDPEAGGAARAIVLAKEEAGITGKEAIYVNAHGTSTLPNDATETLAYKKAFGEDAYKLHISSTKSMTGHMLGAAGGAEILACMLALGGDFVPPTINYQEKDEECDLDYTPGKALSMPLDYAMSSSLGFGGHNAVVVLKKYRG